MNQTLDAHFNPSIRENICLPLFLFSVMNAGHSVHKFGIGVHVGHRYSASAILGHDNKTVIFELKDLTSGETERWADPNHNTWAVRKTIGSSTEHHVHYWRRSGIDLLRLIAGRSVHHEVHGFRWTLLDSCVERTNISSN
jgi:hypothetical protein